VTSATSFGEGLERAADAVLGAARAAAKDLRVGEKRDAEVAPDEAAPGRGDRVEELGVGGKLLAWVEQPGVDAAEHVLVAQRLSAVREGHHDAQPGADERSELLLGFGEPAGRDRRPLGLERERLAGRERVELGSAVQRLRLELLLVPDLADPVRLPDEVGRAAERRDEIVRDRRRRDAGEGRLGAVAAALGRRIDDGALDRMQRPLRERRVRAHRLDLVAEELDAERLAAGGREDVDDAAADRELAPLLGALHALVAGEGKALGQVVLGVVGEADRGRALSGRRHALGECRSRGGDELPGGEHVERAGPLADEVRRRVEPGAPADAPAWKQRDPLVPEEPGRGLRCVAGLGVLRQHDDQAVVEPEVERGEEERKRRLGDARARARAVRRLDGETLVRGGERVRERLEALALGELLRDDV
jgi:hypothetical protein